jgi:altronate hydrolase
MTTSRALKLDPRDNVLIALVPLAAGESVAWAGKSYTPSTNIPAKHKFAEGPLQPGDPVLMYGVIVGRAREPIAQGSLITTRNLAHDASGFTGDREPYNWTAPDVSLWRSRTFDGYHRLDGQVGTRNYWLVLPLVFCENRNIDALREAFEEELGYGRPKLYREQVRSLIEEHRTGHAPRDARHPAAAREPERVFPGVDGIRFLVHQGGCGGTREDAQNLCGLLAGYIHHPNVAGATVLSLGCQHAQASILSEELALRDPSRSKPVLFYEQQKSGTETAMLSRAIADTFDGLAAANRLTRTPAPMTALTVGLKCGGSDGFSGISANPALGHVADVLAALGGKSILSEFPELCGVEQELINRCATQETADRFTALMRDYAARAKAVHSGFEMNPSPGNIADGLITDAMKSAGAARKGGASPVADVLDYPEYVRTPGLSLLCTPGNDVECVTAQAAAGANLVLFTTGLGTPTGNPVAPVLKIATNHALAERMPDIIDLDAGSVISGERSIEQVGDEILSLMLDVASGRMQTKAESLAQYDFIPWKRGVSL